ncbi:MAG TPA: sigma-70 family RNA polymerase sigma factor [Candidatus Acidoferrales bacterium]|nr:sigma-70 family RNA polymerase sigma factor [Candidatus Acidoferrales bacterium]
MARRLCADGSTAEDLVQETLLLAWRGFDQFQTGTNIRAWLFKIMFNAFYARGRKLRSMPAPLELDAPDVTIELPVPATTSPVDRLAVNRAMAGLSDEHRSVLLLAVVEGLTCQETAEVLRVPIGTVMSRLSRARGALREKLQQPRPEVTKDIAQRTACGAKDAR